jgi:hypothetical protein
VTTTVTGRIDAAVSTRATQASVDAVDDYVDTEVAAIKAVTDRLNSTLVSVGSPNAYIFTAEALALAPTGGSAPTAAAIADAVWEEAIGDHSGTSGSTAEALAAAGSAGDPWITALPGAYTAGQAGYLVGNNLDAAVSTRATQTSVDDLPTNAELATALGTADDAVLARLGTPAGASISADVAALKVDTAAIKAKTDNLPTDPADQSLIIAGTDALAALIGTPAVSLAADIAAVPTATENADALLNRDMSAVSDTNDRTLLNAARFIRNKWNVAGTTLTVKKEDDVTTAWTATVSATAGADPVTGNDPA